MKTDVIAVGFVLLLSSCVPPGETNQAQTGPTPTGPAAQNQVASAQPSQTSQIQAEPKVALRTMLERFQTFSAAQIAYQTSVLTNDELLMLSNFAAVGSAFYRRACQAYPALVAVVGAQRMNCQMLAQEYAQAVQYIGEQSLAQNIETERLKIINSYMCASGEIDAQTCSRYMGTVQQIQNAQNQTNQTVNDNIGGRCRVGVDANCVP